jgi:predicted RNA-binding protein YlxR (DUF448 family)
VPVRTCVVCREEKEKDRLYRFVLVRSPTVNSTGEDSLSGGQVAIGIDLLGVEAGRGAYICKSGPCLRNPSAIERLRGILHLGSSATKGERKRVFRAQKRPVAFSVKALLLQLASECVLRPLGSNAKKERAYKEFLEIIADNPPEAPRGPLTSTN